MRNSGSFFGGLLAGAAIGAALALLFAPAKGAETREALGNKLRQLYDELKQMKQKVADGYNQEDLKDKIERLEKQIDQVINRINATE